MKTRYWHDRGIQRRGPARRGLAAGRRSFALTTWNARTNRADVARPGSDDEAPAAEPPPRRFQVAPWSRRSSGRRHSDNLVWCPAVVACVCSCGALLVACGPVVVSAATDPHAVSSDADAPGRSSLPCSGGERHGGGDRRVHGDRGGDLPPPRGPRLRRAGGRTPRRGRRAGGVVVGPDPGARLDVTDPDAVVALVTEAVGSAPSALRALVNNAGIAVVGPVEALTVDDWRQQLEVNVLGQVAVTRALLPVLIRARGRVVMMSSIGGRVAGPLFGPYSASKFAIEAFTDVLRQEVGPLGVRVVAVEPGAIATPIWERGRVAGDGRWDDGRAGGPATATPGSSRPSAQLADRGARDGLPPEAVAEVVGRARDRPASADPLPRRPRRRRPGVARPAAPRPGDGRAGPTGHARRLTPRGMRETAGMRLPDPALVVLVGASGSGKSTWAEAALPGPGDRLLRRAARRRGQRAARPRRLRDAFALLETIVAARLRPRPDHRRRHPRPRRRAPARAGGRRPRAAGLPAVVVLLDDPGRGVPAAQRRPRPAGAGARAGRAAPQGARRAAELEAEGWDLVVPVADDRRARAGRRGARRPHRLPTARTARGCGWCSRSPGSRGARTRWPGSARSPAPRTRRASPGWR